LMPPRHENEEGGGGYGPHMNTIALTILVMGASIALVIILWIWFGHVGAPYSFNRLLDQQAELRQQYGLPPAQAVPKEQLEIPPSLRNLTNTPNNQTG
jgi:hypothetical protein